GTAAKMGDDHAVVRDVRRELRQFARDVFVGQPMEAVAAHAVLIELVWQSIAVGDLGMAAMKRGVEAGDLRQLWLSMPQRADGSEIVGRVKRGKRREGLKSLQHGIADEDRLAVIRPAM